MTNQDVFGPQGQSPFLKWLLITVGFAVLAGYGVMIDHLSELFLSGMVIFIFAWMSRGKIVSDTLSYDRERSAMSAERLGEMSPGALLDPVGDDDPLMQTAKILCESLDSGRTAPVEDIVDAVLAIRYAEAARMSHAGEQILNIGMCGTVIGLLVLFSGFGSIADAKAFSETVVQSLSGVPLALSTTLVGLIGNLLIGSQAAEIVIALDEYRCQLIAQARFIRPKGDSHETY